MKDLKRLVMIVSIIERGNGNKLTKLYDQEQVFTHMRCEGTGTATSEIMDILGLGGSEKDIILSFAPAGTALNLLEKLKDDLHDLCPGRGIAFMVAMEAVTNLLAASIGARTKLEKDREYEDMQEKNSLIMITVNQGFTDEVMSTAKEAGARGGTVVHAKGTGTEYMAKFFGVSIAEEKEIIYIVTKKSQKDDIMRSIMEKAGPRTEAKAVVFSLPVDAVGGLTGLDED